MRTLQLYYTSCRVGHSGYPGFQIRALSDGIAPVDQQEIVRRGNYTPPRDLPSQPTRDEIVEQFPKAFRYYQLPSGHFAITLACYQGQDYTERYGNFFAHTLVGVGAEGEAGTLPPRWPIDYYEWPGWISYLPSAEDTTEAPPPLPPIDLTEIAPAESFSLPELALFLHEAAERRQALVSMLRAVFLYASTSRPILIRDSFLNGLFWIACIQKAFPISCLGGLSFSTYQYDSRDCACINVTIGETDFSGDETDRKFRYFLFDFFGGPSSDVAASEDDYATIVARYMAEAPSRLAELHGFLDTLPGLIRDEDLHPAVFLFQLKLGERQVLSVADWRKLAKWGQRFCQTRPQALELLVEAAAKIEKATPLDVKAELWEELLRVLRLLGRDPAWRDPAAQAVLQHLLAGPEGELQLALHILTGVGADEAALADLSVLLSQRDGKSQPGVERELALGRVLGQVLRGQPEQLAYGVRRRLGQARKWQLLMGEWQEALAQSRDPPTLYRIYRREVIDRDEEAPQLLRSFLARTLAAALPTAQRGAHCLDWLEAGELSQFSNADLLPCLSWANQAIALDVQVAQPAAEALTRLAEETDARLRPHRPNLRRAIELAQKKESPHEALPLAQLSAWLDGIEAADYEQFLSLFLPGALLKAKDGAQQEELLAACFCSGQEQTFIKRYVGSLAAAETHGSRLIDAALELWVGSSDKPWPWLGSAMEKDSLRKKSLDALLGVLSRCEESELAAILACVSALPFLKHPAAMAAWDELRGEQEKRRRSPLAAVKKFFTRNRAG